MARGGLDDHDVGAEVGEHAPADRARLAGQVQDPYPFEQPARHRVPPVGGRAVRPFP
jgi:hypothetical protein